jgi:hypothetical protein
MRRVPRVGEPDAVPFRLVPDDLVPESESRAGGRGGAVERVMQVGAVDAIGLDGGGEVRVTEADERSAVVGDGVHVGDGFGAAGGVGQQAGAVEDGLAGGLEEEPRADGGEGGGALEERHIVAGAGEEDGGERAGDAAPHDRDPLPLPHAASHLMYRAAVQAQRQLSPVLAPVLNIARSKSRRSGFLVAVW